MQKILILDFGGQYNQLIARRVRDQHVYCEILPYTTPLDALRAMGPRGIILTGGPNSVYDPASPTCEAGLFSLGIPVLGICYGSQLMAHLLGGQVQPASVSEYGRTELCIDDGGSALFGDVPRETICWMSHTDRITALPAGFHATAHTADCPVAAWRSCSSRFLNSARSDSGNFIVSLVLDRDVGRRERRTERAATLSASCRRFSCFIISAIE